MLMYKMLFSPKPFRDGSMSFRPYPDKRTRSALDMSLNEGSPSPSDTDIPKVGPTASKKDLVSCPPMPLIVALELMLEFAVFKWPTKASCSASGIFRSAQR